MPNLTLSMLDLALAQNAAPVSSVAQNAAPVSSTAAPVGSTAAPVGTAGGAAGGTAAPQAPQSPFGGFMVPLLLCAVVFYFLILGPERKQRKKRDEMLKKLGKGDKVMTTGGLFASVVGIQDDVVTLQIADGVRARFSRSAIQMVITDEQPATEKVDAEKAIAKR
jgi:preprotein translocase subunit YajC